MAILERVVMINSTIKEILFIYLSALFLPTNICNMDFSILPPSNGYIGIKLNKINNKLEYIIIKFENIPTFIFKDKIIIIKFVIGPAKATIAFFISKILAFFIL